MVLMCVGPRLGLDTFLAKLMSIYDLTSIFLGPGPGEEQEGKFLGRSICWTSYGLTWTGDVKLVNEALQEWDMSTSNGLETPGMIDEYDVSTVMRLQSSCPRRRPQSTEELQQSSITFHLTIP